MNGGPGGRFARTRAVFTVRRNQCVKDGIESKDPPLINNRQAGRRNRGRNNGRPNGGNRGGDNGNRIDNRARGNAPQLLEKYRNMARDAQLAGDRVNTEYYLQFADHYFRVIADNRARQEEHQARFRRNDEPLYDDGDQSDGNFDDVGGNSYGEIESPERPQRELRRDASGEPQYVSPQLSADDEGEAGGGDESNRGSSQPARGRRGRPPRKVEVPMANDEPGFDVAILPPAIARADNDSDDGNADAGAGEEPAPRRRGRPRRAAAEAAE
jgi:hypothetical protein